MQPGVSFRNYHPGAAMESLCRRLLGEITAAAPADATTSIRVERGDDGSFSARIEVRSKWGGFLGRGHDAFDSVAASKAAKHLLDSLMLWKQGRFGDPTYRVG